MIIPMPLNIIDNYGDVIMCMDVMKVNEVPFLANISRVINIRTATHIILLGFHNHC